MQLSEINKRIDQTQVEGLTSFYIEIIAKEGIRTFTPRDEEDIEFDEE